MGDKVWLFLTLSLIVGTCLCARVPVSGKDAPKCGYQSCNKEQPGMINVHLVPHTHDDPGWIISVDEYYYNFVQFILDSVIPALEENPDRRFIYVEMAFFSRWWNEDMSEKTKDRVRKLVNEGRLEFILGGWVMNDEAATHYTAIIDQHKRGFEFLRQNFGECGRTKIGWQIDPFGHSREQASLFAQFGFDGLFFGRLDYQDKRWRQKNHTMEMVWEGSPTSLGPSTSLFTGVLPNGYDFPRGFNFDVSDVFHWDTKLFIHDDPKLHDYNVKEKVDGFIKYVNEYRSWYNTDHVIVTMGSDFNYVDAQLNFKEIDKLIKYVNGRQENGSKINLLYSTPSCYLKALNNDGRTWTTKEDDFLPYATSDHSYWSGFYTSRPAQKYFTRFTNAYYQAVKKLAALAKVDNRAGSLNKITALSDAVSLGQHHDAITGTEKQTTAYDYSERIAAAFTRAKDVVNEAYKTVMPKKGLPTVPEQVVCEYSNVSVCSLTQKYNEFEVTVFNANAAERRFDVRVPVDGGKYQVLDSNGQSLVPSDTFPVMPSVSGVRPRSLTPAQNELVFATTVKGLGFRTFFVKGDQNAPRRHVKISEQKESSIEGEFYLVKFDDGGNIKSITNKKEGITADFSQSFHYYNGSQGMGQRSGAYIFRPESQTAEAVNLTKWDGIFKGQVVQEARQYFSDWITQVVRVYNNSPTIEMEWTVGPIPVKDRQGKEVITRYSLTGWRNHKTFYTSSNGREILERRLNYRPTWPVTIKEPVAGNYYPIDTLLYIRSGKSAFAVLPDRSEGGSSLYEGDVELMLHRRLLYDDNFGVAEALDEPGYDHKGLVVRGRHHLILASIDSLAQYHRVGAQNMFQQPLTTFSHSALSPQQYVDQFTTQWSGLVSGKNVPPQVNILSFEKFRAGGPVPSPAGTVPYLVRFEHFYEAGEDAKRSQPVSFDISDMFKGFVIESIHELSLAANIAVNDVKRLVWTTPQGKTPSRLARAVNGTTVSLKPMQIATIQINFKA